ncbi:PLP-dependent aminotransferase family protein [Sulfitobacter aestuarii]|uniref:PLP-dependent aminotransferase family protein n=1 Tax=Sulfitobacter aestuarii TaxID=2161676 RepID=A0ABW5U6L6_9RHOB
MPIQRVPPEIFFLDKSSDRSLQSQIRETVVSSILSHQAAPGASMPSSRNLASHLGIARMTVTLAYQELVAQGYLEARQRSGYLVADIDADQRMTAARSRPKASGSVDWNQFLNSSLATRQRVQKPIDWRRTPYPFLYGQMDSQLFNHAAWRDCARQAMGRRDFDDMAGDFAASDDPMLVNFIRSRILPRRGISANTDEIMVTVGAQNGLWLVTELLTRKPLNAVCENPGYPDTIQALRWCGAKVTTIDVDGDGLLPDRIPQDTRAVFVTPSHHAPTGATLPLDRRRELLARAERDNFVIVEDDYEFEMSFLGAPSPSLKSLDEAGRVIYVGSFSKALFPGLRLGYLVGPPTLIAEARQLRSLILRHPPGHLQRTAAYFLAQGHYDILIRDMRREYAKRREVMQKALASTSIEVAGAARFGGSCLWLKAPAGTDTVLLARQLLEDEVLIEPGAPFFDGAQPPTEYFRLGYSSIPAERIEEGVRRIAARLATGSAQAPEME